MAFEYDGQHSIFLSFSWEGTQVVSFSKGRRWSGWHGGWKHSEGHFTVTFHWTGRNDRAWAHHIFHVNGNLMYMQEFGVTKLLHRKMATLVMTQGQLGDTRYQNSDSSNYEDRPVNCCTDHGVVAPARVDEVWEIV